MKLLTNSIIYTVVLFFQQGISFFLLPFYTHFLSPSEYGIIAVVGSLTSFLSILYLLSLHGAATRFYYKYKNSPDAVQEIFGTILIIVIIFSACFTILLIVFRNNLIQPIIRNIDFSPYILLGLLSVLLNPVFLLYQSILQARQEGWRFGVSNFSFFILNISLTIIFLSVFELQAKGVLLANLLTNIVFFIITLFLFIPQVKFKINKFYLKESFKYSLPLVPHSLTAWTTVMINSILINNLRTKSEAGIFNIGNQFSFVIATITTAVNKAFVPWFFEKIESGESGKIDIARLSEIIVAFFCLLSLFLSLFSKEALILMTSREFHSAWIIIPILSNAFVFKGMYYIYACSIFVEKTKKILYVTLSASFISVVLNVALIPKFGIIGAAAATYIALFTQAIIALIVGNKTYPIPYNWKRMFILIGISFLFSITVFIDFNINKHIFFILKIFIIIIFCFIIYLYNNELILLYIKRIMNKYRNLNFRI